ncbi:MAG TPA: caspase family protein, partial [Nonomuraea sp.]|nr:caspase family protein [Nonomuraea sp.]
PWTREGRRMAGKRTGRSLHIGLNRVDPTKYIDRTGQGWDGRLDWCEKDAQDMAELARAQGFEISVLLTADATADNIAQAIRTAAATLGDGDIFWITYSGHGGYLPDTGGDEPDKRDETWVVYDRQMLDDELYREYGAFAPGMRVVVVSDSCFSGGIHGGFPRMGYATKAMPDDVARVDQDRRGDVYRSLKAAGPPDETVRENLAARMVFLTACDEDEEAMVGAKNSVFTDVLRRVWNRGRFEGDYRALYQALTDKSPSFQTPQQRVQGPGEPDLLSERPFTIG